MGGIRRGERVRQVGQIRQVRRVGWRECCFEKEGKLAPAVRGTSYKLALAGASLRQQCKLAPAVRGTSYKLALAVKFRLLMMIGFVFEDCKGSVELFHKK